MKGFLASLSLLWTIIGLGSSSPIRGRSCSVSGRSSRGPYTVPERTPKGSRKRSSATRSNVCTFLILSNFVATEHESISVDLKCDKPETYNIIKGCQTTVEFDLFLDKSTVKSRVRCLEKSMGVTKVTTNVETREEECGFEKIDSIVIQSGDVVYDVIQYWCPDIYPHDKFVTSLNERYFTAIIPTDGGYLTTSRKGKAMRTNDLIEFRFIGSRKGYAESWKTDLRFEPKRAPRPQTTIAFIEYNGEIETVDAKSVGPKMKTTYDVLVLSEEQSLDYRLLTRNNLPDDDTFQEDASGTYNNPYISLTDPYASPRETSPALEGLIDKLNFKLNSEKGENIRSL